MENLVLKVRRVANQVRRDRALDLGIQSLDIKTMVRVGIKDLPERQQVFPLGGFIKTDAQVICINDPEIDPRFAGPRSEPTRETRDVHRNGVEKVRLNNLVADAC